MGSDSSEKRPSHELAERGLFTSGSVLQDKVDDDQCDNIKDEKGAIWTSYENHGDHRGRQASKLEEQPQTCKTFEVNPDDEQLVDWTGPDDPENPKNWPSRKKWLVLFVVSSFSFLSPLSSSLVAPALTVIGIDLDIPKGFQLATALSVFVLAYAVGPLFIGPLSEMYGRVRVLQIANVIYLSFNLACGLAQTEAQIFIFRFLAGIGGSAPLAVGGGIVSDLFAAEQRGRAIALYALMPLFGPAVGPIIGAFITQYASWRWAFYITTIADTFLLFVAILLLRETYAPVLLSRKQNRLIKETGDKNLRTRFDQSDNSLSSRLHRASIRPFRLLTTQIVLQVLALYLMFLYGLMYLVIVSFPMLYATPKPMGYGESTAISGLNYISLGLGLFIGNQAIAPLQDKVYVALTKRHPPGRPEYRVPMMLPGALLVPAGLLIYGWTAEYRVHWIGPNIGAAVIAAGTMMGALSAQAFIVDTYTRYAASALAAATVMRSLAGFGLPLAASSLYEHLGFGWGNSLLALIAVVIGWPTPPLLWYHGEILRQWSPYSAS